MYVCHAHAILAVHAIKSVMKDTVVLRQICGNIIMAFFLKLSYSKVRASFTHLGRGACNVSYTLRYMFVDSEI